MYNNYASPILWGFIDCKRSQSDICLSQRDIEAGAQTSKSIQEINIQPPLDSMSWLSKLVRIKADTLAAPVDSKPVKTNVNQPSPKNEGQAIRPLDELLITSKAPSLPLQITNKRAMSRTPVCEGIGAESKRFKFQRESNEQLETNLVSNSRAGTVKRKLTECDNDRAVKRIHASSTPVKQDVTAVRGLDPRSGISQNTCADAFKGKSPAPSIHVNHEDENLDAEVAMFMENAGPPTVSEYRLMPDKRIPLTQTSYTEDQKQTGVLPGPEFRTLDGKIHPFGSPLMINPEPNKTAFRVLEPWPCLPGNTKPDILQEKLAVPFTNVTTVNADLVTKLADHMKEKPSASTTNILPDDEDLDTEVALYMKNAGPPTVMAYRPMLDKYLPHRQTSYTVDTTATVTAPRFLCKEGCFHQFRSPQMIDSRPNRAAIRILDPWPCSYRHKKFGKLKRVGTVDIKNTPDDWKGTCKKCQMILY